MRNWALYFLIIRIFFDITNSFAENVGNEPQDLSIYEDTYALIGPDTTGLADDLVFKFQISSKLKILDSNLYLAYTQRSFMDVMEGSFPFFDHSFRPEVLYRKYAHHEEPLRWWQISILHESNGREEPFSRSWNQISGRLLFQWSSWYVLPQLWIPFLVDNDNFTDFMGFGSLTFGHLWKNDVRLSAWVRPGSKFEKAAVRADLSVPWGSLFSSYKKRTSTGLWLQAFHGYGDSLLGYDMRSTSIAVGFGIQSPLLQ
ncbi:MAG: phospholipase A [Bdellovibrionales bacterium]|nr:phospholipase A [Bdellovibrionales bacterium]